MGWFGNDARAAAMGGGGVATGKNAAPLLTNPALMSFNRPGIWLGLSVVPNWLSIEPRTRPTGRDVPEGIYRTDEDTWQDRPIPTDLLTNARGSTQDLPTEYLFTLAAMGSFGVPGLRIGLGAALPLPTIVDFTGWYNDEREQHFSNRLHFERFGEFDHLFSLFPGVSYSPLDWFSVGLTVKFDLAMGLGTGIYFPQGDQWEYSYISPEGEVSTAIRPIAGVAFRTPFGLDFGLAYRHESYMQVDLDIDLRLWSVEYGPDGPQNQFGQKHTFVAGYEPTEVALGVSYAPIDTLVLEVVGTWQRWSEYLDRHGNDWSTPTTDGDANAAQWQTPKFDDVFTVSGGAELSLAEIAAIRAGVAYHPSPMPSQTGRYNYVDNDLLSYSIGAGFRIPAAGNIFTVDVAAQLWHILELSVTKALPGQRSAAEGGLVDEVPDDLRDYETSEEIAGTDGLQTNNPGFPGYTLGGLALHVMLTIGMEFQ